MATEASFLTWTAQDPDRAWVDIEPGLRFPRYAVLDVVDDPRTTLDLRMTFAFNENQGRYEIDGIEAMRRSPQDWVDGTALRTIPVQELMRELGWAARIRESDEEMPNPLPEDLLQRLKRLGPSSPETLTWVGRVYVTATAISQPAGQAVRDAFGLTTPTASVWIRRARDRGFIPDNWLASNYMPPGDFEIAKAVLRDG